MKMKIARTVFLLALVFLASCSEKITFKKLPEGPISHQLIVLAKVNDGIKAKGFSLATPPNTPIMCTAGEKSASTVSQADGSFELAINDTDIKFADLIFTVENKDYVVGYEVKDLSSSLGKIARVAFSTGKEIDSLSFAETGVLLLSPNAASVGIYDVNNEWILSAKEKASILLNPSAQESLAPRMVAASKDQALVPLSLTHELALLDISQAELKSKTRLKDSLGALFLFTNSPSLTVNLPLDADGSGPKTTITSSFAHSPEAVFFLDDEHFLATFSNYYQFLENNHDSVVGPGIIALMTIKNGELLTKDIKLLNYKNPMHFFAIDKEVWLTCAGAWNKEVSGIYQSHDAGMVKLKVSVDKTALSIEHNLTLTDFSPAEPVVLGNKIIIPHSQQNEVAVIDTNAVNITKSDIIAAKFQRTLKFSFASHWHDDVIILGDEQGSLVAYSLSEGFFPFPFVEPINIDAQLEVAPRLHKLYFRHKIEKTAIKDVPSGFHAWALSINQAKIFALDFLMVFGP